MNQTATAPDPSRHEVRSIPISALVPDDANVRADTNGDPAMQAADDELAASIRAHGLLENLVVVQRDGERYGVTAGARRLRALMRLVDENHFAPDEPVTCLVVPAGEAVETSLAENAVRVGMHPADQVRAFAALTAAGATPGQIAARFGVAERTVQKRLRLGALPDEILDAYRDGRLNADTAEAFASTADTAFQSKLFEQLARGNMLYARNVRYAINERHARSDSPTALFVGIDDYIAAGGRTEDPLFIEDHDTEHITLLDPDVLLETARKRLEDAAAGYAGDWKWTAAMIEYTWADRQRHVVASPFRRGKPTDDEQRRYNDSCAMLEDLDQEMLHDEPDAARRADIRKLAAEHRARAGEIEAAVEKRTAYSRNVRAHGGVVVTIAEDGRLEVHRGLIRREDEAAYRAAVTREPDPAADTDADAPANGATDDASAPAPRYTDALRSDFRVMRTIAVRRALSRDPAAAADILAFTLARQGQARAGHRYEPQALALRRDYQAVYASDAFKDSSAMDHYERFPDAVDASWLDEADTGAAFRAFRALPAADRASILAHAVANLTVHALGDDEGVSGAHEQLVCDLDVDFPAELAAIGAQPFDADMIWNRMNKALILGAGGEALGDDWAKTHRNFKKRDLADAAAKAFGHDPSRDAETDRAAVRWLPPGFLPAAAATSDDDSAGAADEDRQSVTAPADAEGADAAPPATATTVAAPVDNGQPGALPAFLDDAGAA